MKRLAWSAAAVLAFSSLASALCPYTTTFSSYGSSCAPLSQTPPTLTGTADGSSTCNLSIDMNVGQPCGHCGIYVKSQFLIVGMQAANVALPNGCTLLASPDILIQLQPAIGSTVVAGDLPADAALIGHTFYLQGILERVGAFGNTYDIETSNGLEMHIVP